MSEEIIDDQTASVALFGSEFSSSNKYNVQKKLKLIKNMNENTHR